MFSSVSFTISQFSSFRFHSLIQATSIAFAMSDSFDLSELIDSTVLYERATGTFIHSPSPRSIVRSSFEANRDIGGC